MSRRRASGRGRTAEDKLVAAVRGDDVGAFTLPTRRGLSGATIRGGAFLMPNERTARDLAALLAGRDTPRHNTGAKR